MKNADKESQKRYTSVVASRAPGTEGQNEPAQPGGLDGKKNSGQRRSVFFLTPFMELSRSEPRKAFLFGSMGINETDCATRNQGDDSLQCQVASGQGKRKD